jgi:hypothetical protein
MWLEIRYFSILCAAVALSLVGPAEAAAQKWDVEVHGGVGTSSLPASGSGSLPGTGSASAAGVASWYFGDGALALSQALAFFGLNAQVSPLDTTLQGPFAKAASGGVFGMRVDRALTPRFSVEVTFDAWRNLLQVAPESQAALDAASAGFISAWTALLDAPARGTETVTSAVTVQPGRRYTATGALVINLATRGRVTPYATVGAGAVVAGNGSPSAQLVGSYLFSVVPSPDYPVPAPAVYHQTDTLTVSVSQSRAMVGVFGFGVKITGGPRWGVRIDARDQVSGSTRTTLTAAPASEVSQPTGIFILGTSPPLQFSTVTGTPSTLSVPLSGVTTFQETGVRNLFAVTFGWYWRF